MYFVSGRERAALCFLLLSLSLSFLALMLVNISLLEYLTCFCSCYNLRQLYRSDCSLQIYGHGKQTRSFQYVSDLVDGLIALMASNYTLPVNLGNPTEYTIEGKLCISSYSL